MRNVAHATLPERGGKVDRRWCHPQGGPEPLVFPEYGCVRAPSKCCLGLLTADLPDGHTYPSLTSKETEAQRAGMIFFMSHTWKVAEAGFKRGFHSEDRTSPG